MQNLNGKSLLDFISTIVTEMLEQKPIPIPVTDSADQVVPDCQWKNFCTKCPVHALIKGLAHKNEQKNFKP
jgi:hypothetical protein